MVARSDGEPPQVLVATWMRDRGLGPIVAQLEDVSYATIARPQIGGVPSLTADLMVDEDIAAQGPVTELPSDLARELATEPPSPSATSSPNSSPNSTPSAPPSAPATAAPTPSASMARPHPDPPL